MGRKILGLDIAHGAICYALVKNGGRPKLISCGSLPVFSDFGGESGLSDSETDISAVVMTIKEAAVRDRELAKGVDDVAICMSSPQTVVRPISLPALPDSELSAAVDYELSQSFPGIAKTYAVSFKEYSRTKTEIRGIVSFSPKKGLEPYRRLLEQLGYKRAYIDVSANAAAKAWSAFAGGAKGGVTLLCDIGATIARFTVVKGGKILHSRQIAEGVGPELLSGARRAALPRGASEAGDEQMDNVRRTVYSAILEQLTQTVEFYNQNAGAENAISEIRLVGAGADFPGLSQYFSASLSLPVSLVAPPDGVRADSAAFSGAFMAIGAAVREDA